MRALLLLVILVLAACSSSPTGPARHDPTVLITNSTTWPLYFEWRDGQGIAGADTVAGGITRCERFLARPDSAYFYAQITDAGKQATSTYLAPWFNPVANPAFSMAVTPQTNGSPGILVKDTTSGALPC